MAGQLIIACVFSAFFAVVPCYADPFLISDPYPEGPNQPTGFIIKAGASEHRSLPNKLPDGSVCLKFDLAKLSDGEQTLEVIAVREGRKGTNSGSSSKVRVKKNGKDVVIAPSAQGAAPKAVIPPSRRYSGHIKD